MIELTLLREPSQQNATLGTLLVDGKKFCDTLEDLVREVPGEPVSAWKVQGQTAIPAGRYRVKLADSLRFGPDTLAIEDVPGFTFIRIHNGNSCSDTSGCVLVGIRLRSDYITMSVHTLQALKDLLIPRFYDGEECFITIINPEGENHA